MYTNGVNRNSMTLEMQDTVFLPDSKSVRMTFEFFRTTNKNNKQENFLKVTTCPPRTLCPITWWLTKESKSDALLFGFIWVYLC